MITQNSKLKTQNSLIVHPFPPRLPQNPYLDALYAPMEGHGVVVRRPRLRQSLSELMTHGRGRILHLHFFDELVQHPARWQTVLRSLGFLALVGLLRARGVRLVWTVHNLVPHELYHADLAFLVGKTLARWSKLMIVHSAAARAALERRYGPLPQVQVIPIGSYAGLYGTIQQRSAARAALGLPAAGRITLVFGALRPYKNTEGLIAAFAQLSSATRGTLVIAGTGRDSAYSDHIAELAAQTPGVIFHQRYIPDSAMAIYLAAADLIAMPYHKMLTSAVLLCAMSYARPVLAPALAPIRELVEDGKQGFLFAPGDAQALQQAFARALAHPDLDGLGQAGYATAARFPWQAIAEQTVNAYRQVTL